MEPFCHTQFCDPTDSYIQAFCGCAKFRDLSNIPSPSKLTSCFKANNALPCQQRSMKNLHNKVSSRSLGFTDQI